MPITDPLLAQQWHLNQTVPGLLDLNVLSVWDGAGGTAYDGTGVRVFVIDDGFDYLHSDFDNYDQSLDYDFGDEDNDPFGLSTDSHGTAVAGIIGANDDGTGAVGVAYNSAIIGLRTSGTISDAWLTDIQQSLDHARTNFGQVVNISQGMSNALVTAFGGGGLSAALVDNIRTAIGNAVSSGYYGYGMTIVKSAGNSRGTSYDVAADRWTGDTRQVVVAAVNQDGFVSSYSSFGSAVLVSGFGTPGEVVTTDRSGAAGYDAGDFTSGFNGTSSAAPMVSGVVALMYDANGVLGWRDVQNILAYSARHVGSAVNAGPSGSEQYTWRFNGAQNSNGGGLHFSNDYGYGLADAHAAARLSETWFNGNFSIQYSGNEVVGTYAPGAFAPVTIPDANATGTTFTANIGQALSTERVVLTLTFSTTYIGDVRIFLTAPDGTEGTLYRNGLTSQDFNGTWTFESQQFRGSNAQGNWTVRIVDAFGSDVLQVSNIELRAYGAAVSVNDRYVFTDQLSDVTTATGHRDVNDTNGGFDTVNASAVTSDSIIRLIDSPASPLHSSIDGVSVILQNLENAVTGDGDDTIYGTNGGNTLWGMRGNDALYGNNGADLLFGGAGHDTLVGGADADTMYGELGNDDYYVDSSADAVFENFNEGNDRVLASVTYTLAAGVYVERMATTNAGGTGAINLTGNEFAQEMIYGNAGANVLNGGGAADRMSGLGGNDTYFADHAGDIVYEVAGAGTNDTVFTSISYGLTHGQEIERLQTVAPGAVTAINLYGNNYAQRIEGNAGINIIDGRAGADTLVGFAGNDTYYVDNAGDVIIEGTGQGTADKVVCSVSYTLGAGVQVETMLTSSAAAITPLNLTGNELAQTIFGNAGNNILNGKLGNDTMIGGAGLDTFAFDTALSTTLNTDRILDFVAADDQIRLENSIFTGLAAGILGAAQFGIGAGLTSAANASQRIIVNSTNGDVYFDVDGIGGAASVRFANIGAGTAISRSDFTIV